jgi:hypothetical protein
MTDRFAVLGVPRRPLLNDDLLKEVFVRRSEQLHREPEGSVGLAQLNEAFRTLRNPSSRIRHLLELEHGQFPAQQSELELAELFGSVATTIGEFDRCYNLIKSENSPLLRAMRIEELVAARKKLETVQALAERQEQRLINELSELDQQWLSRGKALASHLARIASELSFLQKWSSQTRERSLRFEELL